MKESDREKFDQIGVDESITFISKDGETKVKFTKMTKSEGNCSQWGCSHCAGWLPEGLPEKYLYTDYSLEVKFGNARKYYDPPMHHQEELQDIIYMLMNDGYMVDHIDST